MLLLAGQVLYTAGASLTSGSFLAYYIREWTSSGATIAWFLILPETVHVAAFAAGAFIHRFGSAKKVWLVGSICARGLALALAGVGLADPHGNTAGTVLPMLFALLVASECLRAISYVAFISWISSLSGRRRIGRLFGYRESAIVAVSLVLPPIVAMLRDWLASQHGMTDISAYVRIFICADLIVFCGIAVLACIPASASGDDEKQAEATRPADARVLPIIARLLSDRGTRRVMLTSLHLAAAQGLTQSVLFKYQVDELGLELTQKTLLTSLMFGVQLPLAILTGHWLDRFDNRLVYTFGLVLAAGAMPFIFVAEVDPRWLIAAYAFWGAFAIVNVSGRTLVIRLVAEKDVPAAITLFRFGAGIMAAITGLVGGYWLDEALGGHFAIAALGPYWTIIGVSAIGRLTAPLWLLGWSDQRTVPDAAVPSNST